MIIWLDPNRPTGPQLALALTDGVLSADEFACALDVREAYARAHEAGIAVANAAHERAQMILHDARTQAEALDRASALRRAENEAAGYDDGRRAALEDVHHALQAQMGAEREALRRAESRLAATVMRAVEQVVLETDRAALYARTRMTLQRVIDTQAYVCLRVHPVDAAHAKETLEVASRLAGWTGGYEVVSDAQLRHGDCCCEWDYGVLDAGLEAQLNAIRRALVLAAQDGADDAGFEQSMDRQGGASGTPCDGYAMLADADAVPNTQELGALGALAAAHADVDADAAVEQLAKDRQ
jgi:type III secretion protein L